jgi:hypothetical protein
LGRGRLARRGRRLAPEDGAIFLRGLQAARDRLRRQGQEGGCGSAELRRVKNAEGLVAMAASELATPAARAGGDPYQVVVHVEVEALAAPEAAGCQLEDGPALAAETSGGSPAMRRW